MHAQLTTQERLKDLRVERHLTLKQLGASVDIASSTLGEYENNEYKDISGRSLATLAKFYDVSTDYLLCLTENRLEGRTPIADLHLSDSAIAVLRSGNFNKRLLSEILVHPGFRKLMIDSEIYVDRIVEGRIRDVNAMYECARQKVINETGADPEDLYMQTIQAAQNASNDFSASVIRSDLMEILSTIREDHISDSYTADENGMDLIKTAIEQARICMNPAEKQKMWLLLGKVGINHHNLTEDEIFTISSVFSKSKLLRTPGSMRGRSGKKKW